MSVLRCPVCGRGLVKLEKVWTCENRHSFDIAKQGYVNLLIHGGSGRRHGDDKRMVLARRDFLDRGHYDPLSRLISSLCCRYAGDEALLLDAGCGEGKYTCDAVNALRNAGKTASAVGVDISKDALIAAAKRDKSLTLAVASSAALPLTDESADIVLNIFSPFVREEFCRVLKPEGVLIRAWPLERHLWELKTLVYDKPYPNPPADPECEDFRLLEARELKYSIHLESPEEISALFEMTPYYYKTGREDQQKAADAKELTVTLEFGVGVYRKEGL